MKLIAHIVLVIAVLALGFTAGRALSMTQGTYTLRPYTGVGSGVLKHGTIVKIVNDQPVVVGHFDDDSGKDYPGTMVLEQTR